MKREHPPQPRPMCCNPLAVPLPVCSAPAPHWSCSVAKFRTDCPKSGPGNFTGKSEVSDCNAFRVFIAWVSPTLIVASASNARSKVSSHSFLISDWIAASGSPFNPAVCIFPTTVAPNEIAPMQSRSGLTRSFLRSTSECACARMCDMETTSAGVVSNVAALAARSSGVDCPARCRHSGAHRGPADRRRCRHPVAQLRQAEALEAGRQVSRVGAGVIFRRISRVMMGFGSNLGPRSHCVRQTLPVSD